MPAGDLPQNQPQPESNQSEYSFTVNAAHQSKEEWQTVDFPHAIPVDQIPVSDSGGIEPMALSNLPEIPSFLEKTPQVQPDIHSHAVGDHSTDFIHALQDCNQDLVERITELEAELDQCQQALREKETLLNQRVQELGLAQEQVTRLFGKQELSNQVIQRQQVLVETLTQQWEDSQVKMAQMERDCALTQQRYNEQLHELMQTQNMYRELRSRLHRQQRHTLQFKAALERCLEQPARLESQNRQPNPNPSERIRDATVLSESEPAQPITTVTSTPVVSKLPPVQPWSVQSDAEEESVEVLEDILQAQEEEDHQTPQQMSEPFNPFLHLTPEATLKVQPDEPDEPDKTEEVVELTPEDEIQFEIEADIEEWPQPQFLEDELDRIRAEYASLGENDSELSLLEELPEPLENADSESFVLDLPRKPNPTQPHQSVPATAKQPASNWPAPLIQDQPQQKLRSLASIELPKLPKVYHWTPESTAVEIVEEIEPF